MPQDTQITRDSMVPYCTFSYWFLELFYYSILTDGETEARGYLRTSSKKQVQMGFQLGSVILNPWLPSLYKQHPCYLECDL